MCVRPPRLKNLSVEQAALESRRKRGHAIAVNVSEEENYVEPSVSNSWWFSQRGTAVGDITVYRKL